MKARIEFAPDGKHYQTIKTASTVLKLWDYFISLEIKLQLVCNPYAKFRLISENNNLIGCLPT